MRNFVILVDSNDKQTGVSDKLLAHEYGLLHRAFSVFVYRESSSGIELLIQKRSSTKYHCPGLWTNTCCSHPQPNEATKEAAFSRIQEELGLIVTKEIEYRGNFTYKSKLANGLIEHELDHVFVVAYNNEEININPHEVEEVKWINIIDLKQDLELNTQNYTPWFSKALTCANIMQN